MLVLFSEVPIGGRFEFRGRRYEKLALSLARDEERCGNVFLDHTEVCVESGAARLTPSTATGPSRPDNSPPRAALPLQSWADHLSVAPGQLTASRSVSRACSGGRLSSRYE